uniref:AIG1-type G domain-containing protein n=1 Tax=Xiphophorus couchianus TaxID=32473 RepID=A0A3B5LQ14_9TELE
MEIYGRRVTVVDTPSWAVPADPEDDDERNTDDNAGAESDSPLRLLLLGWKGVGKSSVGNSILGRRFFESGQETELCLRRQALVCGRRVTIVDTPGWDWFSVSRTPKRIRQESHPSAIPDFSNFRNSAPHVGDTNFHPAFTSWL